MTHVLYCLYLSIILFIVMSSWVAADPSAGKVGTRSYVHSNILAIRNGCINASSMRQYIDQHPNIRLKEEAQDNMNSKGNHEGPFGVQTKFADESMKALMQGEYTNFADDDTDYPDTSNIMKMSSFPMPISTKASELLMSKRRQEKEKSETPTKHFCMKKFQGVESKLFKELNLTPTRKIKGKNGATQSQSPTKFQNSVEQFRVSNPDLLSPPMV